MDNIKHSVWNWDRLIYTEWTEHDAPYIIFDQENFFRSYKNDYLLVVL